MCENDEFVGWVLSRREVLGMLGVTGAMLLIGCSTGDDDDDSPTATATSTVSGTGATAATDPPSTTSEPGSEAISTATTAATEEQAAATDSELSEEEAAFQRAVEFTQCMRRQGFEGLPDPQLTGDGFMLMGVPIVPVEGWEVAQRECQAPAVEGAGGEQGGDQSGVSAGWEEIVPGGDCQCSDGSEFSFLVRKADPSKVMLFLQDGGSCFSTETCGPDSGSYNTTVFEGPGAAGIFDFTDERNPFADYSVVYVYYCTGDVHLGNATTEYGPGLTIQHKGLVNGTAALDYLAATFPEAKDVVVAGESAGSVAAPLYAGLVSDRLPDARITVLANGSGSHPDVPAVNARLVAAWGLDNAMPDWPENADVTADQWSVPRLFIQSGRHDPDIVFARIDYAYDERQSLWYSLVGLPDGDLLADIDANEAQIEDAGVNLVSYTAPGSDHTVLTDGSFYTLEVNGQTLLDWVDKLIHGEPVADVHCDECAMG